RAVTRSFDGEDVCLYRSSPHRAVSSPADDRTEVAMRRSLAASPARALALLLAAFAASPTAVQAAPSRPITLEVDLRDAPRTLVHAHEVIPAAPGPLTLYYPKWIPGEHAPSGPIRDLAGLRLSAGGKSLPWRRDDVDLYAFHCDVPEGADSVQVSLDYLGSTAKEGYTSG